MSGYSVLCLQQRRTLQRWRQRRRWQRTSRRRRRAVSSPRLEWPRGSPALRLLPRRLSICVCRTWGCDKRPNRASGQSHLLGHLSPCRVPLAARHSIGGTNKLLQPQKLLCRAPNGAPVLGGEVREAPEAVEPYLSPALFCGFQLRLYMRQSNESRGCPLPLFELALWQRALAHGKRAYWQVGMS